MAPHFKVEPLDLWYMEKFSENWGLSFRIKRGLYSALSDYQRIDVLEAEEFGKLLLLDAAIMLTERDEFAYHEMLVHVPLLTHPAPRRVLVIGGGDGGTLREISRHPEVEEVIQVEIDQEVIRVSQEFFPQLATGFQDPRVKIEVTDGIKYMAQCPQGSFDVILVDSTDPKGPAEGLFTHEFYANCQKALKEDGILTVQSGSPYFQQDLLARVHRSFRDLFPVARIYLSGVISYGGLWAFSLGSKKYDPLQGPCREFPLENLKYYTPQIHKGAFILPKYLEELLDL
jgi:spermidine synthase